jgi:hypothetical protein
MKLGLQPILRCFQYGDGDTKPALLELRSSKVFIVGSMAMAVFTVSISERMLLDIVLAESCCRIGSLT